MKYAILIYESAQDLNIHRDQGQAHDELSAAYRAYTKALTEAGVMRGGQELALPETAITLISRPNQRPLVQDGPYADTKEQLGGFFIIETTSQEEALAWAARCPAMATGQVELRPLLT